MLRSQKRLIKLIAGLPILIVLFALLYMVGMTVFENEPRGFWEALEFAAETLSTTGYGADARWDHPAMVIFIIIMQFIGVFLVFLVFPVYLIPVLEERFEVRLPQEAPAARDHVIVYRYGPPVATLIEQTRRQGLDSVIIEAEERQARRLMDRGYSVVVGPLDDTVLDRGGLRHARALIANGTDDENAAVILGAALAARASERISPRVEGAQVLGGRLVVSEVRIEKDSRLAGQTLAQSELGSRTGVTIIGQWVAGNLEAPPTKEMVMVPGGILLVAGSAGSVRRLAQLGAGATPLRRSGHFLLAGYGEVGQKVAELLRSVGEEVEVIDRDAAEGVDVVGNILDHRVLDKVEVRSAQAVIVAVDSDSATLFATVILKDYAPETPVIARVNEAQNVERIHRAGADFALSISQVSGQILAAKLLGQEAIALGQQIRVLKVSPAAFAGRTPAELAVRESTGVSIVAVERGEELRMELDPDFVFAAGDVVYICGGEVGIQKFLSAFPAST